jgi:hypothetical protein
MKMPTTILCIILTAITITSVNTDVPNQLPLKLSSIETGQIPAAMPPEDMQVDIQSLSNEPVYAPPSYFDNCGVLVQSLECQPGWR